MQLNEQEKDQLHILIVTFIGDDASISASKIGFNEQTVLIVEKMIAANIKCNEDLRQLVSDLLSGGRVLATGWLRRSLGAASRAVKQSSLKGRGCQATSKWLWKTQILASTVSY